MRREWEPEDLIACWTLAEADHELVANKRGATRLGFALLLKFFELEARFPRETADLPPDAVRYVAEQIRVDPASWRRTRGRDVRSSITAPRSGRLTGFGSPVELSRDRLREALLVRCRQQRIEPPGRIDRIVGAAVAAFEERWAVVTVTITTSLPKLTSIAVGFDGPKHAPADIAAQVLDAVDAVEAGQEELLADGQTRRMKAALPRDQELIYPDIEKQWQATHS